MQCVILAAGEGTRLRPLTEHTPKPLLKVAGKPIINHIVSALPSEVDEIIIVANYLDDQIKAHCGDIFFGRPVTYIRQKDPKGGTGDALLAAKDVLKDTFLMMYGDDIHGKEALEEIVKCEHGIMGAKVDEPGKFGALAISEDGTLDHIEEKSPNPASDIVNIGGFVVNKTIFDYTFSPNAQGERYVTDLMTGYAKDNPVKVIIQPLWLPIGYPEDIKKAERVLSSGIGG